MQEVRGWQLIALAIHTPYARGKILATTEDDFRKLQRAWAVIRQRGPEAVFVFTGSNIRCR
jgi:hypothetical protein